MKTDEPRSSRGLLLTWMLGSGRKAEGGHILNPGWEAILEKLSRLDGDPPGSITLEVIDEVGTAGEAMSVQVIFEDRVYFVMQRVLDADGEHGVMTFATSPTRTGRVSILGDLWPFAETRGETRPVVECFRRFFGGISIDPSLLD